jgi:hypothetical protein
VFKLYIETHFSSQKIYEKHLQLYINDSKTYCPRSYLTCLEKELAMLIYYELESELESEMESEMESELESELVRLNGQVKHL